MNQEAEIAVIKNNMANIEKKLDNLISSFSDFRKEYKHDQAGLENKFAGKWTERALVFIMTSVASIIIGALIYGVLK